MKGLAINKRFYSTIVKPIIDINFSGLKYACGLIGSGSEVLGIDDLTSRDHNWGLRLLIFLEGKDINLKQKISNVLSKELVDTFEGINTNWSTSAEDGSRTPVPSNGEIDHNIAIFNIPEYLQLHFGFMEIANLTDEQWLMISEQKLLEFVSGEIFYDSVGEITNLRTQMNYYPSQIKMLNLLGEWKAIASEIAFIGRARMLYDEIGTHLIACRLINRMMRISFILEDQYIPYAKWFGSKFYYLNLAKRLLPLFQQIISTSNWEEREDCLVKGYLVLTNEMKKLNLINIEIKEIFFYTRPQKIINIMDLITNLSLKLDKELIKRYSWGSINQIIPISDIIDDKNYLSNLFKQ